MSELLSRRINTLLLNARAPFPSQVKTAKEAIMAWRREQRLRLVERCKNGKESAK